MGRVSTCRALARVWRGERSLEFLEKNRKGGENYSVNATRKGKNWKRDFRFKNQHGRKNHSRRSKTQLKGKGRQTEKADAFQSPSLERGIEEGGVVRTSG